MFQRGLYRLLPKVVSPKCEINTIKYCNKNRYLGTISLSNYEAKPIKEGKPFVYLTIIDYNIMNVKSAWILNLIISTFAVITMLENKVGANAEIIQDRSALQHLLPKSQDELPTRNMQVLLLLP